MLNNMLFSSAVLYERHINVGSGKVQLSPLGPTLGNLKGVRLAGLLRDR